MVTGFSLLVGGLLAFELGVGVRSSGNGPRVTPALLTSLWILAAVGFASAIHLRLGHVRMFEFVTGYLIEYALSVDNLFVFLVIFSHFQVAREHQPRVLFWGILTAIVLRLMFIAARSLGE